MSYPELPHFAAPFAFTNGAATVVEQDSSEEIAACVYNVAACPVAFRGDQPDFGIPDPTFGPAPLDTTAIIAAVYRWEPRADLALNDVAVALDQAKRQLTVNVAPRS